MEQEQVTCDDHSHNHNHHASNTCCDNDEHNHNHHASNSCCDNDEHNHNHHASSDIKHKNDTLIIAEVDSVHDITKAEVVCDHCDPSSTIPHAIQITRFRIANLCCAGEERIIMSSLQPVRGISSVSVNIIGRYAIVKHCPVQCCAPSDKIVTLLNDKKLGASIQENNGPDDDETVEGFLDYKKLLNLIIVWSFFIAGLISQKILQPNISITDHAEEHSIPNITLALFITSIALGICPILKSCAVTVLRRTLDINFLIVVATAASLAVFEYMDAALVINLFIAAEMVEDAIMRWVRKSIKGTGTNIATKATLLNGKTVNINDLNIGDVVTARAGELIPVDGIIKNGSAIVDESALTGESLPVMKKTQDRVISGTIVQNGYLEITVDTNIADSTLNKLNKAVADVQTEKGEYAKLVDQFALYWTPIILAVSFFLVIIGGSITKMWDIYVIKAVTLLVLACPCSIVIAAPIPSICAIAIGSRRGILIRGSTVIEKMGLITDVAADKTGTLTSGFFKVVDKVYINRTGDDYDPLELAAAIEEKSIHPLANAVVSDFCGCIAEMEGNLPATRSIKVVEGQGINGWVEYDNDWKFVNVGNEKLFQKNGGKIILSEVEEAAVNNFIQLNQNVAIIYILVDDQLKLILALADEIRKESFDMVQNLKNMKINVSMVTGDHTDVATRVCDKLNIPQNQCYSRMLPNEKLNWITNYESSNDRHVLMIGDGINDAAALAASTVGVAMGVGGSAMASAAAGVIMMNDNLLRIPETIKLCKYARTIIIENCVFSIGIKVIGVGLAVSGNLTIWQAMLIDIGSLIVVIINGTKPLKVLMGEKKAGENNVV
jgi:Cd2+/Zn2+-exporting ATPase